MAKTNMVSDYKTATVTNREIRLKFSYGNMQLEFNISYLLMVQPSNNIDGSRVLQTHA